MSTLLDIAKQAGVSVETVSRVLNGKYKGAQNRGRARVEQIRTIARALDYRPCAAARALKTRRTRQIGVVLNSTPASLFGVPSTLEFLVGINEGLERRGFVTLLARLLDPRHSVALPSRCVEENMLDGLIVLDQIGDRLSRPLRRRFPHFVAVNSNPWHPTGCLRRDERQAGRIAGGELARLGYRSALYVNKKETDHYAFPDRLEGFRQGFVPAGGALDVWSRPPETPEEDSRLLAAGENRGRVLVAADTVVALRLLSTCARLGLRLGVDVGFAALDENTQFSDYWPELARVRHDRFAIGLAAADMMTAALEGRAAECVSRETPSVWIAGSTAPKVPAGTPAAGRSPRRKSRPRADRVRPPPP